VYLQVPQGLCKHGEVKQYGVAAPTEMWHGIQSDVCSESVTLAAEASPP
jgi:hypothetical protein